LTLCFFDVERSYLGQASNDRQAVRILSSRVIITKQSCIPIEGGNAEKCSVKVAKQILCAVKCMQKGK